MYQPLNLDLGILMELWYHDKSLQMNNWNLEMICQKALKMSSQNVPLEGSFPQSIGIWSGG